MDVFGWVTLAWVTVIAVGWRPVARWIRRNQPCQQCLQLARETRRAHEQATLADPPSRDVWAAADRKHMELAAHMLTHPDTAAAVWEGTEEALAELAREHQEDHGGS